MKNFNYFLLALLATLLGTGSARAAAATPSTVGQIKAFIVTGTVTDTPAGGTAATLNKGDLVHVGDRVTTGADGTCLLVFSNGAAMQIKPGSKLDIRGYKQTDFDEAAMGSFIRLQKDPSVSTTDLNLDTGNLVGDVKKLNISGGSKFTVDTPAGSAGIRGTVLNITVTRDASGAVTGITVACATGSITLTINGNAVGGRTATVTGGSQAILLTTQQNPNGPITSTTLNPATYSGQPAQQAVDALYSDINAAIIANTPVGQLPQLLTPPLVSPPTTPTITNGGAGTVTTTTTTVTLPNTNQTIISQ